MKTPLLLLSAVTFLLVLPPHANAILIEVNGASGPWNVALNPDYPYGEPVAGRPNVNLPPAVVDNLSGLDFIAGYELTISSLTPGQPTLLAGRGGTLWSDAGGVPWWSAGPPDPAQYMIGDLYLEEVVGTFARNGVIVGRPFAIGNGPTTVTIPDDANQLLMGVNDSWYNDNGGSVTLSVTETSSTVPETCPTILLLGFIWVAGVAVNHGCRRPLAV